MADDDDFEEGSSSDDMMQGSSKKKGGRKGLFIILLAVLLLVGIVIGVYSLGLVDSLMSGGETPPTEEGGMPAQPTTAPATTVSPTGQPGVVQPAVFLDLPVMIVNLNSSNPDAPRKPVLKILVCLELSNPTDTQKIEQVMPRIVDSFQVYLRELRPEELSGSSGLERLREELITRINHATQPIRIKDVLFKEMLVQ